MNDPMITWGFVESERDIFESKVNQEENISCYYSLLVRFYILDLVTFKVLGERRRTIKFEKYLQ